MKLGTVFVETWCSYDVN